MLIVAINGSYRKGRTNDTLVDRAIEGVRSVDPEAEVKKIADQTKPAADPAMKELSANVAALRSELAAIQKSLSTVAGIGKDVKTLSLEVQKIQALVKKPSP